MQSLDLTLPTPPRTSPSTRRYWNLPKIKSRAKNSYDFGNRRNRWSSSGAACLRVHDEVNEAACRQQCIPILRRSSGGAAIVAGPGCLMYALVLSYELRPELRDISRAHSFILGRLAATVGALLADVGTVSRAGTSDLVIERGAPRGTRRSGEKNAGVPFENSPEIASGSSGPICCITARCFTISIWR